MFYIPRRRRTKRSMNRTVERRSFDWRHGRLFGRVDPPFILPHPIQSGDYDPYMPAVYSCTYQRNSPSVFVSIYLSFFIKFSYFIFLLLLVGDDSYACLVGGLYCATWWRLMPPRPVESISFLPVITSSRRPSFSGDCTARAALKAFIRLGWGVGVIVL